jgi:xyloglucan-specific exo-beta-1,4-glucanase
MKPFFARFVFMFVALSVLVSCARVQEFAPDPASTGVPKNPKVLEASIKARIAISNAIPEPLSSYLVKKPIGWSNVVIGGGGYVTGVVIHPKVKDVVYVRTDIGGIFRWDEKAKAWTALTDFLGPDQANDYGTESIALDPSNPDVVYIATGNYDQDFADVGKIYRSSDKGRTWTKISPDWQVKMGGGQYRRWAGERLAVSPTNPEVILFGSRHDGLWRTQDGGQSWQQQNFEGLNADFGIQSLLFDLAQPGRVYGAFYNAGIYRSDDDGATWTKLAGSPPRGMRLALSGKGTLWVTYEKTTTAEGGVAKLEGSTWTTFRPAGEPVDVYNAIAVNPFDDQDIVVAPTEKYASAPTYRSRDGGATWQAINWKFKNTAPWVDKIDFGLDSWFQGEQAAFAFDPHKEGRFWMTDWFQAARSDDMKAATPTLTNWVYNLENTVNLALATNGSGQLLSGFADTGGFFHDKGLGEYPSSQLPKLEGQTPVDGNIYTWNYTTGFAVVETKPNVVYRVGCTCWNTLNGLAKSSDGGKTWMLVYEWAVDQDKNGRALRVAVSPTDENNLVVMRYGAPAQASLDGGKTWTDSSGVPNGENNSFYWGQPLTSDGANANTFYYYDDAAKTVARSDDGGKTFMVVASDLANDAPDNRRGYLEATPGKAGDLWLALENNGLYHSTDAGVTWTKLGNVTQARTVALGKAALPESPPTLYIYGKVNGQSGIWMSIDSGQTWFNLQHPKLPIGAVPNNLEASRTEVGRLFVGTVGRGIYTFTLGFKSEPSK